MAGPRLPSRCQYGDADQLTQFCRSARRGSQHSHEIAKASTVNASTGRRHNLPVS